MTIKVNCPTCNEPHRLGDGKAGEVVRCKHCDERIHVPGEKYDRPARPRTASRKSDQGSSLLLILGLVGGGFLLLLLLAGTVIGISVYKAGQAARRAADDARNRAALIPNPPPQGFNAPFVRNEPTDVNEALQWLAQGGGRAEQAAAWLDRQPPNPAFAPQVVAAIDRHYASATVGGFARETFLNAMATWSGPQDVPVLVRSLDFAFNGKVLDALVRHKNDEAARGVARKLDGLTFFEASKTLIRMGSTAEDAVADHMLTTPNGTSKHEAARILEIIGTNRSVPKMQQAMAADGALQFQGNKTIAAIKNR